MNRRNRLTAFICIAAIIAVVVLFIVQPWQGAESSSTSATATDTKPAQFDKNQYSLDDPTSLWVIVNKRRPLQPIDYAPSLTTPAVGLRLPGSNPEMQLSTQIIPSVEKLFAAAKTDGLELIVASGYRSYKAQVTVYGNEVKGNGQQAADRESARPGHSEHQTGLALDVGAASRKCEIEACFGDMPEGQWIAKNAYKYGFIVRYGSANEAITGYMYEPWHLRYVGNKLADELHRQSDPALENFFGLDAAPDYQ